MVVAQGIRYSRDKDLLTLMYYIHCKEDCGS